MFYDVLKKNAFFTEKRQKNDNFNLKMNPDEIPQN
jgi:hypothetical protein